MSKIIEFVDLDAWKRAHALSLEIYKQTKTFPREELFGLTSQLRRAAVSVTSNIAEGFGRGSYKDRLRFFYNAHGSLNEIKSQLILVKDLNLVSLADFQLIFAISNSTHAVLQGLIRATRKKITPVLE